MNYNDKLVFKYCNHKKKNYGVRFIHDIPVLYSLRGLKKHEEVTFDDALSYNGENVQIILKNAISKRV